MPATASPTCPARRATPEPSRVVVGPHASRRNEAHAVTGVGPAPCIQGEDHDGACVHIQTRDRDGTDHHETQVEPASGNRPPNNQDGAGTAEDQRPPDLPERTKGPNRAAGTAGDPPAADHATLANGTAVGGTAPRAPPPPPPSRHRHGPPGPATCQPPPNDLAGGANRGNHGMEVWNAGGGQRNG